MAELLLRMRMKKQLRKLFQNTMVIKKKEISDIFFLYNLDQHISSINSVVRVQLAQRRIRNNEYHRGGFNNRGLLINE